MSQVPATPPELRSREDTPAESLLARLRKITGLTEAELPPVPPEKPLPQGPPVDRLITALREATAVTAACGIAIAVSLTALGVRLLQCSVCVARSVANRLKRHLLERKSGPRTPPPPAVREALPEAVEPEPEKESPGHLFHESPAAEIIVPKKQEEPGDVSEGNSAAEEAAPAPVPAAMSPLRRMGMRRALAVSLLLMCALPSLLLIPAIRYQVTSLLGWGNATVIAGVDGWLFPRASASPSPGLEDIAARLRADGATLIVVSVPAKAAVYPEKVQASHQGGLERAAGVTAAQQKLTGSGALLLDLGPVLHAKKAGSPGGEPVFRAQSSFWSPRGMELSAAAVAAFVQQQPGYASLPLRPELPVLARHTLKAPLEDLAADFDSARWRSEHPAPPLHFIRLLGADNKPLPSDPASPVVLLGGREIRIYDDPALTPAPDNPPAGERLSAGFAQYCAMYLSTPVDLLTAESAAAAAEQWIKLRTAEERRTRRFIIWLVPDGDMGP